MLDNGLTFVDFLGCLRLLLMRGEEYFKKMYTWNIGKFLGGGEGYNHRRRIELEDKAKVVVSVWGTEFVQFLAALVVLPR